MKKEEMFIELWEIRPPENYYQTDKIRIPIFYSPPFHVQCMNAAWYDLGNAPPRWKNWKKVHV